MYNPLISKDNNKKIKKLYNTVHSIQIVSI